MAYLPLALDFALIVLLTMRVTRFFVLDDLGRSWIAALPHNRVTTFVRNMTDCIYCTSVWAAALSVWTWYLIPAPWWQLAAAPFAVAWVAAHIGVRVGDAGYDEDES